MYCVCGANVRVRLSQAAPCIHLFISWYYANWHELTHRQLHLQQLHMSRATAVVNVCSRGSVMHETGSLQPLRVQASLTVPLLVWLACCYSPVGRVGCRCATSLCFTMRLRFLTALTAGYASVHVSRYVCWKHCFPCVWLLVAL